MNLTEETEATRTVETSWVRRAVDTLWLLVKLERQVNRLEAAVIERERRNQRQANAKNRIKSVRG